MKSQCRTVQHSTVEHSTAPHCTLQQIPWLHTDISMMLCVSLRPLISSTAAVPVVIDVDVPTCCCCYWWFSYCSISAAAALAPSYLILEIMLMLVYSVYRCLLHKVWSVLSVMVLMSCGTCQIYLHNSVTIMQAELNSNASHWLKSNQNESPRS